MNYSVYSMFWLRNIKCTVGMCFKSNLEQIDWSPIHNRSQRKEMSTIQHNDVKVGIRKSCVESVVYISKLHKSAILFYILVYFSKIEKKNLNCSCVYKIRCT